MLINCPECGKEISDKAKVCIHCGYPIKNINTDTHENMCIIDGVLRDLTKYKKSFDETKRVYSGDFEKEFGLDFYNAYTLRKIIEFRHEIPSVYDSSKREQYERELEPYYEKQKAGFPRCPICKSTNLQKISTATKVAKVGFFGIFGAGDVGKTWKCNNCGSKF